MHSVFSRRCTTALAVCVSSAVLSGCGNGSATLTPIGHVTTPTASPSAAPSTTATPTATPVPTATPTARPSATPTPTATLTAHPSPTPTPTPTPTARPTATPTPTPSAVASDTETGTSRTDGSKPGEVDINVSTAATLPLGESVGLTYFVGSTNASLTPPIETSSYYLSNPGSFAVAGKVVVAVQSTLTETPAVLDLPSDRLTEIYFTYSAANVSTTILAPGSTYTCTIFDGKTLIGSNSSTVGGSSTYPAYELCALQYPANYYSLTYGAGDAFVNMPATLNTGDVYTFIISQ